MDEASVVGAHKAAYQDNNASGLDASSMGSAAALQVRTIPAGMQIIFCTGVGDFLQTEENAGALHAIDHLRSDASLKAGNGGRVPWKDVTKFDPSRWIVIDEKSGAKRFNHKAGYNNAFGLGPRICAGKNLAVSRIVYL